MRILRIAAIAMLAAAPLAAKAGDQSTLRLSGNGAVSVAPELATISVGVNTAGKTAGEALADNTAMAASVIGALKDAGVEDADIQTSNFGIQPVYSDRKYSSSSEPGIDGYRVTNMVTARVRDLPRVGVVLDTLVSVGANTINGISFGLEDDTAARDKARELAVEDAIRKAGLLAAKAGVSLGPIQSISTHGGGGAPAGLAYEMAARAPVPVQAGALTISETVEIVWQITGP